MITTQEAMDKLTAADPLSMDDLHGWVLTTEGKRVLNDVIVNASPSRRSTRFPRLPARSIAAASAILLIVGLVTLRSNGPTSSPGVPSANDAEDVLKDAALVAALSEGLAAEPGEFIYRRIEAQGTVTMDVKGRQITAVVPTTMEVWAAADGSRGVVSGKTAAPEFMTLEDRQWWIEADRPTFTEVATNQLPDPDHPQEDLESYPRNPDDLHAFLRRKAPSQRDPNIYVFTAAADILLRFPDAAPELRSALFEVLSRVPGTDFDPDALDPNGRAGASVSFEIAQDGGRHRRYEMYLEPNTAEVLGSKEVLVEPDGSETTYAYSVLIASGVVASPLERP